MLWPMQRTPLRWIAQAGIAVLLCVAPLVGCSAHQENEKRTGLPSRESTWLKLLDQTSFRTTSKNLSEYPELSRILVDGITVPGLAHNFVPQGISWVPDRGGLVLISGYVGKDLVGRWRPQWRDDSKQAVVILMDVKKKGPVRAGLLMKKNGEPMPLHAGGVAISGRYFWVPARFRVYRFPIRALLESNDKVVSLSPVEAEGYRVDALGSFVSFYGKHLWVGDFVPKTSEAVRHHRVRKGGKAYAAWTAGYLLNENEEICSSNRDDGSGTYNHKGRKWLKPDVVFFHRKRVQGIAFYGDGRLVLSVSYGNNKSKFAFYDLGSDPWNKSVVEQTPLPGPDHLTVPSRTVGKLPGECKWLRTLKGPPGSQGIAWNETHLITLFEGGAKPYRDRWTVLGWTIHKRWDVLEDRIMILKLP